jgi:hypothetical protein
MKGVHGESKGRHLAAALEEDMDWNVCEMSREEVALRADLSNKGKPAPKYLMS